VRNIEGEREKKKKNKHKISRVYEGEKPSKHRKISMNLFNYVVFLKVREVNLYSLQ
jgi:hypothetical protein